MPYVKPNVASKALGVSAAQLRRMADAGQLPDNAVIATPGGHYFYDVDPILAHLQKCYRTQTRLSRMRSPTQRNHT